MGRKGNVFSKIEIRRMIDLLFLTDMSIGEIAERMNCSRSAVVTINRKYSVRDYCGRRSVWRVQAEVKRDKALVG